MKNTYSSVGGVGLRCRRKAGIGQGELDLESEREGDRERDRCLVIEGDRDPERLRSDRFFELLLSCGELERDRRVDF